MRQGTVLQGADGEYIRRIDAYDQKGPSLNAVILVNPNAVKEAEQHDVTIKEKGPVGPLHGIPVLLKDNVETGDMVTTSGSLSLKDYMPDDDAFLTKRLKAAGAIILAKANMHEFAVWGESVSSILGQALNPTTSREPRRLQRRHGRARRRIRRVGSERILINSIRFALRRRARAWAFAPRSDW